MQLGMQSYKHMLIILVECPSYAIMKNWTASFQSGKFSTEDEDRSGRPISASSFVNIDAFGETWFYQTV